MDHTHSGRWLMVVGSLLILSVVAACAPARPPEPPPGSSSLPDAFQVKTELGPGDLDLLDLGVGLAELPSYKAVLTISFDGTRDGQPEKWSRTREMLSSSQPAARQLTVEGTPALAAYEPVVRAEGYGVSYEVLADGSCVGTVLNPAESTLERLAPSAFLQGLFGAEAAGHETVDGVEAEHYTFDERALAHAGVTKSSGEVWIASSEGYVVRYIATTTGGPEYFGKGIEGTQTWDYQLSHVGVPPAFDLPASCPPGLVDAPLMPDAIAVQSEPGLLRFETAASPAEVLAFYDEELSPMGWVNPTTTNIPEGVSPEEYQQLMEDLEAMGMSQYGSLLAPAGDDSENMRAYDRDDQTLSVIVEQDGSITKVMLSLSNVLEQSSAP